MLMTVLSMLTAVHLMITVRMVLTMLAQALQLTLQAEASHILQQHLSFRRTQRLTLLLQAVHSALM